MCYLSKLFVDLSVGSLFITMTLMMLRTLAIVIGICRTLSITLIISLLVVNGVVNLLLTLMKLISILRWQVDLPLLTKGEKTVSLNTTETPMQYTAWIGVTVSEG